MFFTLTCYHDVCLCNHLCDKQFSHDAAHFMSRDVRKPDFCICENKAADQLCGKRTTDQRLCFRYIDSTIPLLPKSEISSLQPSSVISQPGLCRTWSETPKTGFLTSRLLWFWCISGKEPAAWKQCRPNWCWSFCRLLNLWINIDVSFQYVPLWGNLSLGFSPDDMKTGLYSLSR